MASTNKRCPFRKYESESNISRFIGYDTGGYTGERDSSEATGSNNIIQLIDGYWYPIYRKDEEFQFCLGKECMACLTLEDGREVCGLIMKPILYQEVEFLK